MNRWGAGLLAATVAAGAAAWAAEKGVEDFLPANAVVALCYYGDNPDLPKTALAQLAAEPEVQEWLKSVRGALAAVQQQAMAALQMNPDLLTPLLGCRIGVAVLMPEGLGPPAVLAVARVGGPESAARRGAEAFLAQLGGVARAAGLAGPLQGQVGGIEVTQYARAPVQLCYGFSGDFLLVSSSLAALRRALIPEAPKLSSTASFQRAATLSGSPVALLLYNHERLMEGVGGVLGPNAQALFDSLGVSQARAVGVRLGAKGRALVGSLFVQTAGERRGLLGALAAPPVDRSLLRLAPRDSSLAWVTTADPAQVYEAVLGIAHTIVAFGRADLRGALARFEQRAGVSLSRDLLGSLDRGTVITTAAESLLPALILSQKVKDGERFDAAVAKVIPPLDALIKEEMGPGAGAQLKTIEYGGHTIRYVATPGIPLPFALCYTRVGDRAVFALSPIHLKDYLTFLDKQEPSVLDNPRYKELEALVPPNASSVTYAEAGEQFLLLYRMGGPLLTMLQGIPDLPMELDLANLPSVRTVRRHLFGSISYSYSTGDFYVHESQSPFGFDILCPAPALAVAALVAVRAAPTAREEAAVRLPMPQPVGAEARRVQDMNNLNQIVRAVATYLNEFGDNRWYPASLGELVERRLIADLRVLVSPADPRPPRLRNGVPCSYNSAFDRHPNRRFRDDFAPNLILAWTRKPFFNGMRNVVFFDAHVETMTEDAFQRALQALDEAVKRLPERRPAGGQF